MTSAESVTGAAHPDAAAAGDPTASRLGWTTIADAAVSKIAGLAVRDVDGVHGLGGNATRAVGALRERIPGAVTNHTQGISVEVGEKQAAIDIDIVAEYGVALPEVAATIRRTVISAVERMTGLEVVEVNITIHDVHLPDAGEPAEDSPARVE